MIEDRVAIVTGGTGALGAVVASELAVHGFSVLVPHSPMSAVRPKAPVTGTSPILSVAADLRREEDSKRVIETAMQQYGRVDLLVNALGGFAGGDPVDQIDVTEWDMMMELNLKTAFLMTRAALRVMREAKRGRIVNISAMPAVLPSTHRAAYAISKRGVATLTEIVADEIKGTGITCNAIAPSILLTEANVRSMPDADRTKWVTPIEIARLILFLCSEDARSVNGNVIRVFGGI
jgi:NAD(P)-dependent dehydrogenase (short-subunit alcohol dehydrogenase family)